MQDLMETFLLSKPEFQIIFNPSNELIETMKLYPKDSDKGSFQGEATKFFVYGGEALIDTTRLYQCKWFDSHGFSLSYNTPEEKPVINVENQLVVFNWLKNNGYEYNRNLCEYLFRNASDELSPKEIVDWCKNKNIKIRPISYKIAAEKYRENFLQICKYLHSEGCALDAYVAGDIVTSVINSEELEEIIFFLIENTSDISFIFRSLLKHNKDELFKKFYLSYYDKGTKEVCCDIANEGNLSL